MIATDHKSDLPVASTLLDGFDILDVCHRQTVFTLGKLAALVSQLQRNGTDAQARDLAAEIVHYFSTTARAHHEDEERHVFPPLLASGEPELVDAVLRLQQDHHWLHIDWNELSPQLEAIAAGLAAYNIDALIEGTQVFIALSHAHIALEESCIYPEARARLRDRDRHKIAREMAARRHARRGV